MLWRLLPFVIYGRVKKKCPEVSLYADQENSPTTSMEQLIS